MIYAYSAADPRQRPAHYMYAPFEGRGLFEAFTDDRRRLLASLPVAEDGIAPASSALPPVPAAIRTRECLEQCAATAMTPGRDGLNGWDDFFLRKIEIARRLRAAYGVDGRMSEDADAGADAYAYAAALFATRSTIAQPHDSLRWLNACLKSLDLLSVLGATNLSAFGARCATRAIDCEQQMVRGLANRHRIGWP